MSNPKLLRGRVSQPGAYYTLTTVTHERQPVFSEPGLAHIVIAEIENCVRGGLATSIAWVVMPDHLHWLVELRDGSLSRCVQAMKSRSARAINAARGAQGQVWQSGFYDHQVRADEDLISQARYIVANPLRRGLVQCIDDYPFWWCRWIERETDL